MEKALRHVLRLVATALAGWLVWAFLVHDGRKDIDLGRWVGAEDAVQPSRHLRHTHDVPIR